MNLQATVFDRNEAISCFIKEHGWGPAGSMVSHAILILLLLKFAVNSVVMTGDPVPATIYKPEADIIEPNPPAPKPDPTLSTIPDDIANDNTWAVSTHDIDIEMPGEVPGTGPGAGNREGMGIDDASLARGFDMDNVKSSLVMAGLYDTRTPGGRDGAMKRNGGTPLGEGAVLMALQWLKVHQEADGSWAGAGSPTAMCGLALLCYMAHGEIPSSQEFGQTVGKAIKYLLSAQEPGGRFKNAGVNFAYGHAIATYALAESFGMTKMVILKEPLEKAVQIIIDGQQGGGAFDYNYAKGGRRDMSVTAWQVQALKAAKLAGAGNNGLQECLYKCVDGVKSFAGPGGGFGYTGAGSKQSLNGAGVLCMQFLDLAADPLAKNTLRAGDNKLPSWPKDVFTTYGWYYMTQALFQNGNDPAWKAWNGTMAPMLVKNQSPDGHWDSGSTHSACPVYDTALCCLCLEVYYRYLPTYMRAGEVARKPRSQGDADAKLATQIAL